MNRTSPRTSPRIGYNQFIHIEWVRKAVEIRAGLAKPESLDSFLVHTCSASSARTRATTMLNRMWLNPPAHLEPLANRAAGIFRSDPDIPPAALAWGMSMAAYPFFTETAMITGRLTGLYDYCDPAAVQRRMTEIYGETDSIRNAVNTILKSQINWGLLKQVPNDRIPVKPDPLSLSNPDLLQWMVTAVLSATDRPLILDTIGLHPLMYSFDIGEHPGFILLNAPELNIYPDSSGNRFVSIKESVKQANPANVKQGFPVVSGDPAAGPADSGNLVAGQNQKPVSGNPEFESPESENHEPEGPEF